MRSSPSDEIRDALERILLESDGGRALDSIELTAIRAYLVERGLDPPAGAAPDLQTLDDWTAWVEHSSRGS